MMACVKPCHSHVLLIYRWVAVTPPHSSYMAQPSLAPRRVWQARLAYVEAVVASCMQALSGKGLSMLASV